ncbi:MAG: hypothetical protein JSV89_08135 [Spirochaetaceae bacterium]|nr:MAG: hypothetical protein JSV89_08135 [Spirochaetaceae bacterium]
MSTGILLLAGGSVDGREFASIRNTLGKTQEQLARLLGLSPKAVQSAEQEWRNISIQTERHLLFLLFLKVSSVENLQPCWLTRNCPSETRDRCPAWELNAGQLCWFVNGTICRGREQDSWKKKMKICRQCEVFPLKKYLSSQ